MYVLSLYFLLSDATISGLRHTTVIMKYKEIVVNNL